MDLKALWASGWVKAGAVAAIVGIVVVLAVFQPQKLFIDQRVDEALPEVTTQPTPDVASPSPQRMTIASGRFRPLAHRASGSAQAIELGGGKRIVRLEDLDVENGPDLFVYLSSSPPDVRDEDDFDDDFIDLGRLKGNKGDQNYTLPASVDLDRYATVVIWCRRFTTAFAAAALA